jgi:CheY-like chemotaxis protein
MSEKIRRGVLVVDDERLMRDILRDTFDDCAETADCPYAFDVEVAGSAAACVEKIRERGRRDDRAPFDVIVLDVRMEAERSGLETAFALQEQLGAESPVRIILTGYPNYGDCVEAMRYGAWDYIVKQDVGQTPMAQVVVNSAVERLRRLDQRREQETRVAAGWIPAHLLDLQAEHAGRLVALWHEPEVRVIASGRDAFELEERLKDWHGEHDAWEQPFVVQVPPRYADCREET